MDIKVGRKAIEEASKKLSNWGRWGKDDHIGTLNHVTPENIADAAQLIKAGKVFAHTSAYDAAIASWMTSRGESDGYPRHLSLILEKAYGLRYGENPHQGGAFYRDVPPGRYHIHVDSYIDDPHNDRDVDLAPGAEAYAKVLPLDNQVLGGGGEVSGGYRRNVFVVWLYPPDAARAAVAHSYFQAGGS